VENHLSEYEYATRPLLNWIKTNFPKVKVTIHDYSEDMLKDTDRDESWVYAAKDFLQPAHVTKFTTYHTMDQRTLVDQGKKICILYGIDKPKICHKDNKWYLYFIDFQANYANSDVGDYNNITNEYFFWTPDFPEILLKQAHIIVNYMRNPPSQDLDSNYLTKDPWMYWLGPDNKHLSYRITTRTATKINGKLYYLTTAGLNRLIYPDWREDTFSLGKNIGYIFGPRDRWWWQAHRDKNRIMFRTAFESYFNKFTNWGFNNFKLLINPI
jgi:hypothetical protein